MSGRWILLDLALVGVAFAYAATAMSYPWQLAVLVALAVGAFSYAARRTWTNLRSLHRPPEERWERAPDEDPPSDAAPEARRPDDRR